jgi:hypothetical protein
MLRLWIDALSARDAASVVRVADLIRQRNASSQSRLRQDSIRRTARRTSSIIRYLRSGLSNEVVSFFLSEPMKPISIRDALLISVGAPFIPVLAAHRSHRPHFFIAWVSQHLHLPFYAHDWGIPPLVTKLVTSAIVSYGQVRTINDVTGVVDFSMGHFLATGAVVFGCQLLRHAILKWLLADLHLAIAIPIFVVIDLCASYVTIQLSEYGLGAVLERIGDRVLFNDAAVVPQSALPITEVPPESLQCGICHELVTDPVLVEGFLCCRDCLVSWINANEDYIHPLTGKGFCSEDIRASGIYRCLAWKYYQAIAPRGDA